LNWGLLWHVLLYGRSIRKNAGTARHDVKTKSVSARALKGILTSLRNTVQSFRYPIEKGNWAQCYVDNSYSDQTMSHKEELVDAWLAFRSKPDLVIDLGGNAGRFTEIASKYSKRVVFVDSDHDSVELVAREFERSGVENVHTAVLDLTDYLVGRRWAGSESRGFYSRIKPQQSLALTLIHHLVIGAGNPMEIVAAHFREV